MLLVLLVTALHAVCASVVTEQSELDTDVSAYFQRKHAQLQVPNHSQKAALHANAVERFEEVGRGDPGDRADAFYHYWIIARAKRHQHGIYQPGPQIYSQGVMEFLETAGRLEIGFVFISMVMFVWVYAVLLDWPNPRTPHCAALILWMAWAGACLVAVGVTCGRAEASGWVTGYLLELIFSIENVFVFHVVCQAFKAPAHLTQKALFLVILGQVLFQAIFFMGLANWLHHRVFLPYLLGAWLVYAGIETFRSHHENTLDVRDSCAFRFCHGILGKRLSPEFPHDGHIFFLTKDGGISCTMLAPLALSLFFLDTLFEVDVSLTKIETLNSDFMCFSSSVVAACAVPELYFVARNIFEKYSLLRYGVSFVLLFYGVQLLLHQFFELPALAGIVLVMAVMCLCVSCSDKRAALKGGESEPLGQANSSIA